MKREKNQSREQNEPLKLFDLKEPRSKAVDWEKGLSRSGGEEGIRTLDTLLTYTPLAGERLQPLGHLSTAAYGWVLR